MKSIRHLLCLLAVLTFLSNNGYAISPKLPIADSLAREVLEREALYTVMGGLKPMSTVIQFSFDIDSVSREYLDEDKVTAYLTSLQSVIDILESKEVGFVVVPFKAIHGKVRTFHLVAYHRNSVSDKIKEYSSFFLKRGILPEIPLRQILSITEFENSLDRLRAYGYLFGYPGHAVDFFVEASAHYEETKEFVERDFFQIPVSSREDGRFVYAVPKGHEPQEVDLRIKESALKLLDEYRALKEEHVTGEVPYAYLELYWILLREYN